jgi:two-component system response regulator (stage 0 sporulation protein F)
MAKPKMVVIDDEIEFSKALDRFFGLRGYEVRIALRGMSAIRLVDEHCPDVVLMDLKMPGMDGDQVLTYIREKHPKAKVIMITAYSDERMTRERLLALGAFAYFEKPVSSIQRLAETVKQALAART